MIAGIDVSKNWVDVALIDGSRLRRASPSQAADWLAQRSVNLAVLEATGGYERPMMSALQGHHIAVARVNPRQVRAFAQAKGGRAKNDQLDAVVLAEYGTSMQPKPCALPDPSIETLRALIARRSDMVAMHTQEKNRLAQQSDAWVREQIIGMMTLLKAQIDALNRRIQSWLHAHPSLHTKAALMQTMPGVGPQTAAVLVACLPELGTLSRSAIASLVGVAPHARESGTWKGKRFCSGGRIVVRNALYMAALSTIRRDNRYGHTYRQLTARGKPPKVALVAVMRKMLITLNAMLASNHAFSA